MISGAVVRDEGLRELSDLFLYVGFYPPETLDPCEVVRTKTTPSGSGGFSLCWEGLFLGRHKVAMKCSHSYISDEIADTMKEFGN